MFNIFSKSKITENIFSGNLTQKISQIFTHKKLDLSTIEELEDLFITSDIGAETTNKIIENLKKQKFSKEKITDSDFFEVKKFLQNEILKILEPCQKALELDFTKSPIVIIFNGVNGAGKTTTIAKIAQKLKIQNKKVLLAACDTFRAGACEQLEIWAKKIDIDIVLPNRENEEPSSVAYRSLEFATKNQFDVILIDTAGRLHNKQNLMDELKKINKVIKKIDETAPHHNLLIIDGTTGQNSHNQLESFDEAIKISGIIITKLDGTAKGGAIISLADKFKKPIYAIGVGEKSSDLKEFDAQDFVNNLVK